MKLSVGRKLGLSFSVLCLTILAVALMGIFVISSIGNTVLKEKVPLKDVAMEASIALEQGINSARQYILAEDGLSEIEGKMEEATGDFNMFISMVENGTESETFKNSPAGEMYDHDGLTLIVPKGSNEMLALASEIRKIQPVFNEKMSELMKLHPEKVKYYFDYEDVHYDLTSFLYWADVTHERWFEKVKASVEYDTDFSGELDPTKCAVGRWYATYKTDDKELLAKLEEYSNSHTELHNTARELFNAPENERDSWFSRISRYYSKAKRNLQSLQELSGEKLQALNKAEKACIADVFKATESMQDILQQLEELADSEMMAAQNEADNSKQSAVTIMTIILIVGVLTGIVLGFIVTRSITKPINAIIGDLNEGVSQVSSASAQVAAASQSLAEGSSEQASSLEETSSSLEEMASMTRQNAENTKQAGLLATDASSTTDKGMKAMNNMAEAMQEIKKSSDDTAKIIKVIDEIAFQTNLLALNAAVEAARAGEAGKGFAVVAEEVRNLAQRSAQAAKDTSSLIEGSQKNAEEGVKSTAELVEILKNVTGGIKKVNDLMGEVTAASDEQAQGIEQLNQAVSQMDQLTQQNASIAEESSSASEELASQAHELQSAIGKLSMTVYGSNYGEKLNQNTKARTSAAGSKTHTSKLHTLTNRLSKNKNTSKKKGSSEKQTRPQMNKEEVVSLEEKELAEF